MKRSLIALSIAGCLFGSPPAALAQQSGENIERVRATLLILIRTLVDQGVLSPSKAQEMLREAGLDPALLVAPAAPPPVAEKPVVRVPYVPEVVKEQLREEIKQEVLTQARAERWGDPGALPDWVNRLSFYGDVRLRAQSDRYPNASSLTDDERILYLRQLDAFYQLPPGTTQNAFDTRDRMRLRARVGMNARVSDEVRAGVRITTDDGSGNPTSTNIDLGRYGQRFGATWDLAFIQWNYSPLGSLAGGRLDNPYLTTDLIYSRDLTFDGVVATYRPRLSLSWDSFVTAGAHPLRETESSPLNSSGDQWIYALQAGVGWTGASNSTFKFAVANYRFRNVEGRLNPALPVNNTFFNQQIPQFRRRGNTMVDIAFESAGGGSPVYGLASKFNLLASVLEFEYAKFDPIRINASAEFVRNLGFDEEEIRDRIGSAIAALPVDSSGKTGIDRSGNTAYRLALQVGRHQMVRLGDWQLFAGYRYLESDAVLDGLTSTDYRLGGTGQRATTLGGTLALAPSTSLTLRYVAARSLDAALTPVAPGQPCRLPVGQGFCAAQRYDIDTWFLDLNARF